MTLLPTGAKHGAVVPQVGGNQYRPRAERCGDFAKTGKEGFETAPIPQSEFISVRVYEHLGRRLGMDEGVKRIHARREALRVHAWLRSRGVFRIRGDHLGARELPPFFRQPLDVGNALES